MTAPSEFPHPVYKEAVLAPLFDGAKKYFVEPIRAINRAHLVMLHETGILPVDHCRSLANALADIDASIDTTTLTYTGEYEDYFFLVEAELTKRLGPDVAGMLHTARSRNDMDHTQFKWLLKQRARSTRHHLLRLVDTLLERIDQDESTLIVAYTHGQPAQPTTLAHYLAAALEVLLRDCERLDLAYQQLDHCPMGAAAITTSGFPVNRKRMAELLGFAHVQVNSYGCIASVDYITGVYSALRLIFLHLGRVVQDLQFWSAFEVGQLHVPDALVQISSIMPQKRNPVSIEHLRHLGSMACGHCESIVQTMHNTPFTDMNDSEGEVQQAGYAAFDVGDRTLALLNAVLSDCSIRRDRVQSNIEASCITITELADTLVRTEQLSFRQAHEIAASTATSAIDGQQMLGESYPAFCTAFHRYTQRHTRLSESDYRQAVSAENFVSVRDRLGGPASAAIQNAAQDYRSKRDELNAQWELQSAHQQQAERLLDQTFETLRQS